MIRSSRIRRTNRVSLSHSAATLAGAAGLALTIAAGCAATAANAQSDKLARCRVVSQGQVEFAGTCRFVADGANGSFALEHRNRSRPLYGRITTVSVAVIEPGRAEVRGLTTDGINSRWGTARRSRRNPACWVGSDFRICAWGR